MAGILLIALFTASAALAIASIAVSLHRYGPASLHLRKQLSECPQHMVVRWKVTTVASRPVGAQILRPDFRARAMAPGRRPALLAAA
ncbi:MAG: hypothetical protein R3E09_17820 [Novosphingobium sp.]|nr:hypothetical protein [Novosphingobium sp.]